MDDFSNRYKTGTKGAKRKRSIKRKNLKSIDFSSFEDIYPKITMKNERKSPINIMKKEMSKDLKR